MSLLQILPPIFFNGFYWSIVDLQCCVGFCCTAKWINYTYIYVVLEKALAPHSSTLAWKLPWTEEPGGLQSMGSLGVRHDWATSLSLYFNALEKEMATHSSVLAWRIPGTGEPGGLLTMGSHRVRHDWSDLAAAAAWNRSYNQHKICKIFWEITMTCYKPIKLTACKKLGKFTIMWLPKTELGKNRKSKKFKNG